MRFCDAQRVFVVELPASEEDEPNVVEVVSAFRVSAVATTTALFRVLLVLVVEPF